MRTIILRFDPDDELILAVDDVKKKLNNPISTITKTALWEYCQKILERNK